MPIRLLSAVVSRALARLTPGQRQECFLLFSIIIYINTVGAGFGYIYLSYPIIPYPILFYSILSIIHWLLLLLLLLLEKVCVFGSRAKTEKKKKKKKKRKEKKTNITATANIYTDLSGWVGWNSFPPVWVWLSTRAWLLGARRGWWWAGWVRGIGGVCTGLML